MTTPIAEIAEAAETVARTSRQSIARMQNRGLVIQTAFPGDVILTTPLIRRAAERTGAPVDVVVIPAAAPVLQNNPHIRDIITFDKQGADRGLGGFWRLARKLKTRRYGTAYLAQGSLRTALLAFVARIPRRIGYAREGRTLLLTDAIPVPRPGEIPAHQRYYYLELLRRAGLIDALPECAEIRLRADPEAGYSLLRDFGLRSGRVIGVSPGAQNSQAKQWLPERFAAVASKLAEEWEAEVALFGTAAERELCGLIAELIGPQAHNLGGRTTLGQFLDLAAACLAFVTNDSGSMHVAAAVGTPTVAVFGPTNVEATGPSSSLARVVRIPVECSPCEHRRCPIDHRCMTRVEPEMVLAAALTLHGHAKQDH